VLLVHQVDHQLSQHNPTFCLQSAKDAAHQYCKSTFTTHSTAQTKLITLQAVALCALGVTVAHPSRHNHARLHDREVTSKSMHIHSQHNHSSIATTPLTPPASTSSSTSTSVKRKHHTRSHVNSHEPKGNATSTAHTHTTVKHARPHHGTTEVPSTGYAHPHHHHHEHHEQQHQHNATATHVNHRTNTIARRDVSPSANTLIKSHSTTTPLTTTLLITNKVTPTPKGKPASTTTIVITPVSSSTPPATTATGTSLQSLYGQCYGSYYTGPTACVAGATCQINGPWWGQCASATGSSATPTFSSSGSVMPMITSSTSVLPKSSVASTTKPSSSVSSKTQTTKTTKAKTTKTKTTAVASQTVPMMIAAPVSPAAAQAEETMTIGS